MLGGLLPLTGWSGFKCMKPVLSELVMITAATWATCALATCTNHSGLRFQELERRAQSAANETECGVAHTAALNSTLSVVRDILCSRVDSESGI